MLKHLPKDIRAGHIVNSLVLGASLCATIALSDVPVAPIAAQKLVVPQGFHSNDLVSVTLSGYLPSSCYQLDHVERDVDLDTKKIQVRQMVRIFSAPCLLMISEYSTQIDLGYLPEGTYEVSTNGGALKAELNVRSAD